MSIPLKHLALLLALLVLAGPVRAEDEEATPRRSLLWVVEGEPTIYLFGTMHVPDPRVTALAAEVEEALDGSDVFWAEYPMEVASQMQVQQAMLAPPGSGLSKAVPEATYERLAKYLAGRGMNVAAFEGFKTWAVDVTLQILDILPQMATSKPLDQLLYDRMKKAGKDVGGLETVEEQLAIFNGFSVEDQATFLAKTLDRLEAEATAPEGEKTLLERMVDLYVEGDPDKLAAMMTEQYDPEDPAQKEFMIRLLDDRNVRMVDRLLERAAEAPEKTYFVAVGAGHFPGEKGILALLREKGKTVRRVKPAAPATASD